MPDIFVDEEEKDKNIPKITTAPIKKGHNHLHIFASYCDNPSNIQFIDREENEVVLLFLRKHFVTNVPWVGLTIVLLIIPYIIALFADLSAPPFSFLPLNFIAIITVFYYLAVISYAFVNFITWFFNVSIVTNIKIVDIDFSGLVYEHVAATKLNQIEDVSYSQIGVIRSVFDYGDVLVQTAGTAQGFEFLAVPHPEKVVNIVHGLMEGGSPND